MIPSDIKVEFTEGKIPFLQMESFLDSNLADFLSFYDVGLISVYMCVFVCVNIKYYTGKN